MLSLTENKNGVIMKKFVFLLICITSFTGFANKSVKLPSKPLDIKIQRLSFDSVDIKGTAKYFVFNITCSKQVVFASLAVGLVPGEGSVEPVYRMQLKKFPNSDAFSFRLKKSKVTKYFIDSKSLVYYKLTLIDKKGYSEVFKSRFLADIGGKLLNGVVYGPYLDMQSEGNYIISYELAKPEKSFIVVNGKKIKSEKSEKKHFFRLNNLKAGNYTYKIKNDPREFKFKVSNSNAFSFAVLSDCREGKAGFDYNFQAVNEKTLKRLLLNAKANNVDFVLFPGDLVSGYTTNAKDFEKQLKSFAYSTEPVSSSVPIFEGMGNHEAVFDLYFDNPMISFDKLPPFSAEDIFGKVFVNPENGDFREKEGLPPYKENVYWFKYKNNLFVMLNTNYWWASHPETYHGNLEGHIMDKQLNWLKNTLKKQGKGVNNIFVFAHEPAFPVSAHMKDAMWYFGGKPSRNKGIDRRYVVKRRNEFLKILDKFKVKLVFFGDEHNYSRVLINKEIAPIKGEIMQIITGGSGAPFYNLATEIPWKNNIKAFGRSNHYMFITVTKDKVKVKAVSLDKKVIDSFEIK
jgi:hypothetical protein